MCRKAISMSILVAAMSVALPAPHVWADPITYNITGLGLAAPIGINNQGQVGLGGTAYGYAYGTEGYANYEYYPTTVSVYNSLGPNAGKLDPPPASGPIPGGGAGSTVPWVNDNGQSTGVDTNLNAYVKVNGVTSQIGPAFANGDVWVHPQAINDAGQVVGDAALPGVYFIHAFLNSGGTTTDLGTLGGDMSMADAINSHGVVVGLSLTAGTQTSPDGPVHAFVYQNGTMTDLTPALGFNWSRAYGINSQGVIVGDMSSSFYGPWHAFMLVNGQATDLNSLLPPQSGWTLVAATGINDLGQIVGIGTFDGTAQGFLLTPSALGDPPNVTPEPASLICFAAVFAMAMARRTIAANQVQPIV
jgi:probable HAF family extracellular repeat protein